MAERLVTGKADDAAVLRAGEGGSGADVRTLRAELGTEHGMVHRVARRLGCGTESVRLWVHQADIDEGRAPGMSTDEVARLRALEQEDRELRRAYEIFKQAASFIGAEPDRQHKR